MLSQAALPRLDAASTVVTSSGAERLRVGNRVKSAAALLGLLLLSPLCVAVVAASWLTSLPLRLVESLRTRGGQHRRTVLITGGKMTKALEVCRCFHAAGWRVVLCETPKYWLTGHRFSHAVDRFRRTPELTDPRYAQGLAAIARNEKADLFVPICSPASSRIEANAAPSFPSHCRVLHVDPDQIDLLDDKFLLAEAAAAIGLPAPKSFRITHPTQVDHEFLKAERRPYLLKSIRYDAVRRLDLTRLPFETEAQTRAFVEKLPITNENPWVLQEFIEGDEFCTHSTLHEGRVLVHTCCRSSEFQVNYEHVDIPEIEQWVRRFAAEHRLSGQVSFDFIRAYDDGAYHAIECNPRTHSAITVFHRQREAIAEAYANDTDNVTTLTPASTARPTYWLYHELWRLLASLGSPSRLAVRITVLLRGKDAMFSWRDPLPFLMVHHWQIPLLLAQDVWEGRGWVRLDFNIGKLVQAAGD